VGKGQRLADLLKDRQKARLAVGGVGAGGEQIGQSVSLDQFHGEVEAAVGQPSQGMDRRDGGVLQLAEHLCLLQEAALQVSPTQVVIKQDFHRQGALQDRVAGAVDNAHAATAQFLAQLQVAGAPRGKSSGRRRGQRILRRGRRALGRGAVGRRSRRRSRGRLRPGREARIGVGRHDEDPQEGKNRNA
jgi:hypothetical protein